MLIIIQNDFLLPFPVVVHITKVSIPNHTELLVFTLKVYIVLGVKFKIIIVLLVMLLMLSCVPVTL